MQSLNITLTQTPPRPDFLGKSDQSVKSNPKFGCKSSISAIISANSLSFFLSTNEDKLSAIISELRSDENILIFLSLQSLRML